MSGYATQRARDKIVRLAGQGLDLVTFWRESSEAVARAVPHYMTPCWFTLDPASLLVTSHYQTEIPELPPEWLAHEYFEDDFHKMADVARSERGSRRCTRRPAATRAAAPAGTSTCAPTAADQELLVALRTRAGEAWGMLGLYREPGQPLFAADELRFLREVAPYLAEGARRGLLVGEAADPEGPEAPGLVVLTGGLERRVAHAGRRALARRAARRRLGGARQAAPGGAGGGRPRAADRRARGCAGRGRAGAGALARGPLDGAPRRGARRRRRAARRGHRRARPPGPHRLAADGRLRVDRARAGRHPAGAAGQLDGGDRRRAWRSRRRPSSSTSRASSTRRACAAGASSSARCSSPTTSRACATTSGARSRADRCAAGRWTRERPPEGIWARQEGLRPDPPSTW